MNDMNDGHWSMLAGAIVGQAMKDYRLALKTLRRNPESRAPKYTKDEVEAFFMSRWYRDLTRIDGEKLIRELQEEYL